VKNEVEKHLRLR